MRIRILILTFFIPAILNSQEILKEYIRYALENNLALKQKQAGYEKKY